MKENLENNFILAGAFGGGASPRVPKEAPEGINTGNDLLVLSKTQTKIIDVLSEGEILGLVTGKYNYSGNLGDIGWSGVTFTPNQSAEGTTLKWLQSVFWNDVPVAGQNGLFNFQQTSINYSKGSPNGSYIEDGILDETTSTRLINERLRGVGEEFAKIYRILDKDCIGAEVNIRINQLSKTSTKKKKLGDIEVETIEYSIYYKPILYNQVVNNFTFAKKELITGKVSAGYIRSSRIMFDTSYSNQDNFVGWEIKIVRLTEDSTTTTVRNQSFIDSLTEIYGQKFIYPNTSLVSSLFDAEYFNNVPNRKYLAQLLKIKVPNNYNPIFKTYNESEPWDGTFKTDNDGNILKEWTDNPAWCYYDLLTNKRYGLGKYIDESTVDKFNLYNISKYCDTLVPDGYGGLEPRFTCNLYITSRDEAYKVINSMASIFRGITYYSAGQIYASLDSEKPVLYQFTNANVMDGNFSYSSSSKKARHSIALVRYNDKRNEYKPSIEYVENVEAIQQLGIREVEIPALGCTSRGQAIRLGRWALLTENLETESINFKAGLEVAGFLKPGYIFQVYDNNRNTYRLGGRLTNIIATNSSTNLTLDSNITGFNSSTNYKLSLLTPTYYYDPSLVSGDLTSDDIDNISRPQIQYLTFNTSNVSVISGKTNINISQTLDVNNYHVSGNLVWLIEATGNTVLGDIKAEQWKSYRVINIREQENHVYDIEGLEYNFDKFVQIESGFNFTDIPTPNINFDYPRDLQLTVEQLSPHSKKIDYKFTVNNNSNIREYRVLVKDSAFLTNDEYSGEYIIDVLPKTVYSGSYIPSEDGIYNFRVYSVGINDKLSTSYTSSSVNITDVDPLKDIAISSLQLITGDDLTSNRAGFIASGSYSEDSPTFGWQMGIGGSTNIPSDITYRITVRKPSHNNTPDPEIYYSITGYTSPDSSFTFDFNDNYNSISSLGKDGPFRSYDIVVEAMDWDGNSSAGGQFVYGDNYELISESNNYSNPNGYDIFLAYNNQPLSRPLYEGSTNTAFYSTGYASQQWITQDGEIKIFLTRAGEGVSPSGFYGDDIAGGTLYYSDYPFTIEEAQQKIPTTNTINNIQLSSDGNPIVAPVGLFNVNSQYIALAPYDSFDVAHGNLVNNYLVTGLGWTNVVRIKKSQSNQNYAAWIEFDIGKRSDGTWGLINTWLPKSFNVATITDGVRTILGEEQEVSILTFDNPISTSNYALNVSTHQRSPVKQFFWPEDFERHFDILHIISKNELEIVFPPFSKTFGYLYNESTNPYNPNFDTVASCFVGVLQNS